MNIDSTIRAAKVRYFDSGLKQPVYRTVLQYVLNDLQAKGAEGGQYRVQEIADQTGMCRESASRALGVLHDAGILIWFPGKGTGSVSVLTLVPAKEGQL